VSTRDYPTADEALLALGQIFVPSGALVRGQGRHMGWGHGGGRLSHLRLTFEVGTAPSRVSVETRKSDRPQRCHNSALFHLLGELTGGGLTFPVTIEEIHTGVTIDGRRRQATALVAGDSAVLTAELGDLCVLVTCHVELLEHLDLRSATAAELETYITQTREPELDDAG
jgi:hypothetical protein